MMMPLPTARPCARALFELEVRIIFYKLGKFQFVRPLTFIAYFISMRAMYNSNCGDG